jgi:hypothetical protein
MLAPLRGFGRWTAFALPVVLLLRRWLADSIGS